MDTTIVREVSFKYRGGERLGETLRQPEEVAAVFRRILPDNSREHVMALYLNGAHKVIAYSVYPCSGATLIAENCSGSRHRLIREYIQPRDAPRIFE